MLARILGWFLLALALVPEWRAYGASIGTASRLTELSLAALAPLLLLSHKPRLMMWLLGVPLLLTGWLIVA